MALQIPGGASRRFESACWNALEARAASSGVGAPPVTGARLHTSCRAFKKKSSGSSRCAARGAVLICSHSMKSIFYRAHSLGSRILAAGLLPLLQLRCFSQGNETLTCDKAKSAPFLRLSGIKRGAAKLPFFAGIQASLRPSSVLSREVLFFGLDVAPSACAGAEGQQPPFPFLPTLPGPLGIPGRAARGLGVFTGSV